MRKPYLDNIKWITAVIVVVYHVLYIFNGAGVAGGLGPFAPVQYQDGFLYLVYPWFMLLLFVASGMSARFALDRQPGRAFLRRRTVKLLVPSTVGLFVFWWIQGYFNMAIGGAFEAMPGLPGPVLYLIMVVSGIGPLWYIQLLWLFSLLLLLVRRVEKDRLYALCGRANVPVLLCLTPVIWAAARVLNTPLVEVYRFGLYGAGFFLGYFLFSHDAVMQRLGRWWLPLSLAAAGLGVGFVAAYWGKPYAAHAVLDTLLCNAYAWAAVLAILAVMKTWGGFENALSRFMAARSWGLYLFHYLPLSACAWCLQSRAALPPLAVYLLVGAAAFAGGLGLYALIRRVPLLRWCVCGIGGKRPARSVNGGPRKTKRFPFP